MLLLDDTAAQSTSADSPDPNWAWKSYQPDASGRGTSAGPATCIAGRASGAHGKELQQAQQDGPTRAINRLLRPEADAEASTAL